MDFTTDSFSFHYEQNDFLSHFCSQILPHQKKFYMRALSLFYYKLSLDYWSFDYAGLENEKLFETWMQALDVAYGECLEDDEVQIWLATSLMNSLPVMQRYEQA